MLEKFMESDFVLLSWMNFYLESPCVGDLFYAEFFQAAFARFQDNKQLLPLEEKIPKILHYIWIGEKFFPKESIKNVLSWKALHPDWKIYFWTDRHPPCVEGMEVKKIETAGFLSPYFDTALNPAEKADYLRYYILYEHGGIYVDHDVKCLLSFEGLANSCSFFAIQSHAFSNPFLYLFGKKELHCRFLMDNGILGSKAKCTLWKHVFEAVKSTYDRYTEKWGHYEPICILHRSLLPLTLGIIEYLHQSQDQTICVLPKICQYPHAFKGPLFKPLVKRWALCKNHHAKTWIEKYDRKKMNAIWQSSL